MTEEQIKRMIAVADQLEEAVAAFSAAVTAFEAAMSRLGVQPEPEEPPGLPWSEWRGGFCPVKNDCRVDVRLRDGQEFLAVKASHVQWRKFKDANHVTHWRVHDYGTGQVHD